MENNVGKQDTTRGSKTIIRLSPERAGEAVDVLCEAFHNYPAVRYILGPRNQGYENRLRQLTNFFVMARFLRGEPILAVETDPRTVIGVATVTLPGEREVPPALADLRKALWKELGSAACKRYEAFGRACQQFVVDRPHHHLNMIGVLRSHLKRGVARLLMDSVHELSREDQDSCGVTLNTEDPNNLKLYDHFGYKILGHVNVSDELETWGLFRLNSEIGRLNT